MPWEEGVFYSIGAEAEISAVNASKESVPPMFKISLPLGPFLCTRFRNRKAENQQIKNWRLRNDFRANTSLAQITELESVIDSFYEGHKDLNFRDVAHSGTHHRNASAHEFPIFRNFP